MIIEFISGSDKYLEENDWFQFYMIKIDGKVVFQVHDGETEDNIICRNFNDIYKLPNIFEKVVDAMKNNENIEIKSYRSDEWE